MTKDSDLWHAFQPIEAWQIDLGIVREVTLDVAPFMVRPLLDGLAALPVLVSWRQRPISMKIVSIFKRDAREDILRLEGSRGWLREIHPVQPVEVIYVGRR